MTTPVFIPGWQASIELGNPSVDLTVIGNVLNFSRTRASLPKPVFGSQFRHEIPGQASGTLAASGHVSAAHLADLENLFATSAAGSVPYVIQVGAEGTDTDGGKYTGLAAITEFSIDDDAEGEWDWAISATLDGAPNYTPPV